MKIYTYNNNEHINKIKIVLIEYEYNCIVNKPW